MDNRIGFSKPGGTLQEDADAAQSQMPVSIWLYIAGLCVTLSGLYAVNFGLEDASFANLSYGLAIAGYVFSYVTRARGVDLNAIKMPLLMSGALLFLAYVSGSGAGWLISTGVGDNRSQAMQVLFAWVAIVHTFTLLNDASVLFACVPGMTMLALVSTVSPEQEIQNAFVVFVAASTFLMVHENYLRTRNAKTLRALVAGSGRLFGGQLLLTGVCLFGALILGNLVAVPIEMAGRSLFSASFTPQADTLTRPKPNTIFTVNVNEKTTFALAQGPVTESDTPLLRIQTPRSMYWRGTTFSTYTGASFQNQEQSSDVRPLTGEQPEELQVIQLRKFANAFGAGAFLNRFIYKVPANPYELSPEDMQGSHQEKQEIQVLGGVFSSLYGAGYAREVTTDLPSLRYNFAGTLLADVPVSTFYEMVSQTPTQDEEKLRQAPSEISEVPTDIRRAYLQVPGQNGEDTERVKQLAQRLTQDKTNNFDKTEALRSYVAATCKYNLQASRAPAERDVVAWFLLDKKEGYCDSFAAALTMLCRYANIPARLASGFLPGEIESDGTYLVREKHKHVWTEVFFPHIGWVPFDATDGTTDISDHSNGTKKQQVNFVKWLMSHGSLPIVLAVAMAGLLGYVVKTEVVDRVRLRHNGAAEASIRPQTNLQVMAAYAQADGLLRRKGLTRMPHQTPDEYQAQLAAQLHAALPDVTRAMAQLTGLFTRFRYGRETAMREDVETAQKLAASIREGLQVANRRDMAK